MKASRVLQVITTHTGGEPTCIITGGLGPIPGKTMLEKMLYMQEHEDRIRTAISLEPRGGVRCGVILTEPCTKGADIGVLHFSTSAWMPMCGHNTIGLATAMVETGMVPVTEPMTKIVMDTPAGLVEVVVKVKDGEVQNVTMVNAPAFPIALDVEFVSAKYGKLKTDISYGGNIGALIDADVIGLSLEKENTKTIIKEGLDLFAEIEAQIPIHHPTMPELVLHHVQFYKKNPEEGISERIAVVNRVGNIDRSPCGTGTSAKLAVRVAKGELAIGDEFIHQSLVGSIFRCQVPETVEIKTDADVIEGVIPVIAGDAFITGMGSVIINEKDPQTYGFRMG